MEPQKVTIVDTEKPISVIMEEGQKRVVTRPDGSRSLEPTTTHQEDITKEGQRTINLIWETTQSKIALLVIRAGIYINGIIVIMIIAMAEVYGRDVSSTTVAVIAVSIGFINMIAGIVVGFYFSRTNHQKVGGIGLDKQEGR